MNGEAFILTDGELVHFWDMTCLLWRAAGDTTHAEDIEVVPVWLSVAIALVIEWMFWIDTYLD